jgi:integrase
MSGTSAKPRKRNYGTGGLRQIGNSWYGTWRDESGHKIQKKIGDVRAQGKRKEDGGLSKTEAEEKLRTLRAATGNVVRTDDRVTIEVAGREYVRRLNRNQKRKRSYKLTQASDINNHIAPFFGAKTLDQIKPRDIESYIDAKERGRGGRRPLSIKTIRNHVNTIHAIFELGMRQEWCLSNPVKLAERPTDNGSADAETDIRFLDLTELEQLVGASYPSDAWGSVEPTLYLAAAMTGMRQGELLALRWRDVDFEAKRIRVVKNYVRGQFDTPKSRKSARSVPMASKVDQALLELKAQTDFANKDDLVFCHPDTGNPLDRSKLIRRFKQALERAQVHEITFHELRHTFGTTMAAAGVPMRTIQEWMGHDDIKTTQVYTHYRPSEDEAGAIDRAFS